MPLAFDAVLQYVFLCGMASMALLKLGFSHGGGGRGLGCACSGKAIEQAQGCIKTQGRALRHAATDSSGTQEEE